MIRNALIVTINRLDDENFLKLLIFILKKIDSNNTMRVILPLLQ